MSLADPASSQQSRLSARQCRDERITRSLLVRIR
jgi:hypothetical protein